jgi:TonB family protein
MKNWLSSVGIHIVLLAGAVIAVMHQRGTLGTGAQAIRPLSKPVLEGTFEIVESAPSASREQKKQNPPKASSTEPQSAAASQSTAAGRPGAAMQGYLSDLIGRLNALKRYPESSRDRGEEGTVTLSLVIEPSGTTHSPAIATPSEFEALNRATLEAATHIGTLPPLPENRLQAIRVKVPVVYQLSR